MIIHVNPTCTDLHTPTWLAKLLRKKTSTLANWRYAGTGPKYVKVGQNIFYRESDVAEYLEQCLCGGSI